MSRPLAIAHRGASARELENSLAAFRAALALGADAVELDIHATADGALVVHHDDAIEGRAIARRTLAQLREHPLSNSEPLPTLDEALDVILPGMLAFVEVKALAPAFDAALFRAIDRTARQTRVRVHGFDHRIIRRLSAARPDLSFGALSASYPIHEVRMIQDAGAVALWQEADLVDEDLVAEVHAAGGVVYEWTVDDPGVMHSLLALGVDGLCSNHPDRARKAIDSLPL